MEKLDKYLRIKEAAEYLGVSPNRLRNWGRVFTCPVESLLEMLVSVVGVILRVHTI